MHPCHPQHPDQAPPGASSNEILAAMDQKVERLYIALKEIQNLLSKPVASVEAGHRAAPADTPCSTSPHTTQSPQKDTPVSLDGFMFGEEPNMAMNDLNY